MTTCIIIILYFIARNSYEGGDRLKWQAIEIFIFFSFLDSKQNDSHTCEAWHRRDLMRSPFFYYVFYTSVFPGFVYFRLIQTLDSTPYILHSVFYTSWTMSFLLVAKIVWFYTINCFSSCFLHQCSFLASLLISL